MGSCAFNYFDIFLKIQLQIILTLENAKSSTSISQFRNLQIWTRTLSLTQKIQLPESERERGREREREREKTKTKKALGIAD